MKVIINKCYGGFGLSIKAIKRYLELKKKKCFFYKQSKYNHRDGKEEYQRIDNPTNKDFIIYVFTKDLGKRLNEFPKDCDDFYFYERNIKRSDKTLIKVVEELGAKANGEHTELKIVEVPKDAKWEIEEYDGIEWVRETSRSWG